MALFKHKEFLEHSNDAAFDNSTYHRQAALAAAANS
jgi:hypothetical protein